MGRSIGADFRAHFSAVMVWHRWRTALLPLALALLLLLLLLLPTCTDAALGLRMRREFGSDAAERYAGKVVKGNRNALFLVENGARRQFPDFFTFDKMGFNVSGILKIKDDVLNSIPLGPQIKSIPAPPPFRPDDYMFHEECGDPDRMINDLGLVPNMGHYFRYHNIVKRARARGKIDILALGGRCTHTPHPCHRRPLPAPDA